MWGCSRRDLFIAQAKDKPSIILSMNLMRLVDLEVGAVQGTTRRRH